VPFRKRRGSGSVLFHPGKKKMFRRVFFA
jgi:hypothetical protein